MWTVWVLIKHGNAIVSDDYFRFLLGCISMLYCTWYLIKLLVNKKL